MVKSVTELKQQQSGVQEKSHKLNNVDPVLDPLGFQLAQAFLTTKDTKLVRDLVKWANTPQG